MNNNEFVENNKNNEFVENNKNKNKNNEFVENNKNNNKKNELIHIYSFGLFLNFHIFFYKNIINHYNFYGCIFYFFLFNLFGKYILHYSIYELIYNKLWIKNLNDVALPLIFNSVGNIIILNLNFDYINKTLFEILCLYFFNYYLTLYFPNELETCKMFRFNSALFYFLVWNLI